MKIMSNYYINYMQTKIKFKTNFIYFYNFNNFLLRQIINNSQFYIFSKIYKINI